ncbi:MAG: VOC family protein [Calditrichota bacterium]
MKIEHVAIWTNDLERLKTFYETYFQAKPNEKYVNFEKGFESYFLSFESGARLELMQMTGIPDNLNDTVAQYLGIIHLAISVGSKEKVDQRTAVLEEDGYRIIGQPRTTGDGYYESVVLDPDGNRIEITV